MSATHYCGVFIGGVGLLCTVVVMEGQKCEGRFNGPLSPPGVAQKPPSSTPPTTLAGF